METLGELKQIFKEKGANGLLPQNLPVTLLNAFVEQLIEFTEYNFNYGKMIDENFIAIPHKDTLISLRFLIETFTKVIIGDNSYKMTYDDFNNGFKCIRYHYGIESFSRNRESKLKKPVLTIEMILDKKYLPQQEE